MLNNFVYMKKLILRIAKMNNKDVKAIKEALQRIVKDMQRRQGFICQWCGHKEISIKNGRYHKCPTSPNHHHQFIKASVENKKCPATKKSRSILYRLANY